PQTTRGRIFAIRTTPEHQIILADTPGFHRATDIFGTAMVSVAKEESRGADMILFIADVSVPPGQEDEDIAKFLTKHKEKLEGPVILVGNKIDRLSTEGAKHNLELYQKLFDFESVWLISAVTGAGLQALEDAIA